MRLPVPASIRVAESMPSPVSRAVVTDMPVSLIGAVEQRRPVVMVTVGLPGAHGLFDVMRSASEARSRGIGWTAKRS